jgi:hypothetical protein
MVKSLVDNRKLFGAQEAHRTAGSVAESGEARLLPET